MLSDIEIKNALENILGEEKKKIDTLCAEYTAKYIEIETASKSIIFPKMRELLITRLKEDEKLKRLENFLENCLTNDNKTSWLDHAAWKITDAAANHMLDEYPSEHVGSTISTEDLRSYGYYTVESFIDDIMIFDVITEQIGLRLFVDEMGGGMVTFVFV